MRTPVLDRRTRHIRKHREYIESSNLPTWMGVARRVGNRDRFDDFLRRVASYLTREILKWADFPTAAVD
jgi:hypothetical protein